MDYKSVFTNLCLELQQNRSWIKGLGKNPQKSELIHWRQCLLSGGTEACSLGLRETPACIHVIRLSQPRVACWHGFRQNSQKTECVFTRCPTGGRKKKLRVYTASEAKGLIELNWETFLLYCIELFVLFNNAGVIAVERVEPRCQFGPLIGKFISKDESILETHSTRLWKVKCSFTLWSSRPFVSEETWVWSVCPSEGYLTSGIIT